MSQDQPKFSIATPTWVGDIPASQEYDDVYFSLVDGLKESQYVFVEPNDLPQRFELNQSELTHLPPPFILAEAGFGSGLNFLLTWKNWLSIDPSKRKRLHFISFEKHPLSIDDLSRSLDKWPELSTYADKLCAAYPLTIKGHHTLNFESGKIVLTLVFGDIRESLPDYDFKADCWYLDGFTPSKNPDMWSNELFREVARLTAKGGSFSTFAAASIVRKGLEAAGFQVAKRPGFGKKREMLFGTMVETPRTAFSAKPSSNWSKLDAKLINGSTSLPPTDKQESNHYDVVVVGSGLAGITTANTLSQQGFSVALLDEKEQAVSGASGQSQLVMYAKFPSERNQTFNFVEHCLANSLQYYQSIQSDDSQYRYWHPCGVLQLAWNGKERDKQRRFSENISLPPSFIRPIGAEEATAISGIKQDNGGLWFEKAGWLDPKTYAQSLLDCSSSVISSNGAISTFFEETALSLAQREDSTWQIKTNNRIFSSPYVVVCNSNRAKQFDQLSHLPSKPLRGQVTSIKSKHSEKTIINTKCVLTGEGYLCPSVSDWHHFGATFNLDSVDTTPTREDNLQNFDNIKNWNPNWLGDKADLSQFEVTSNAGLRCTTPDYLPIVGQAPIYSRMLETFAKLRVGANSCKHLYGHYYSGLYVNIGHGSKGAFTTPIAASLITQQICGGIPPFNETMRTMLSPARFIIKHLKQRRI